MWFDKNATIMDYLKYFFKRKGMKVAFCPDLISKNSFLTPYFSNYNEQVASTRLRVHDLIFNSLGLKELTARFLNPFEKFDIIVFQKSFDENAYTIAKKYKEKKSKIILDINVNYFDIKSEYILRRQHTDIINFLKITDMVFTTTEYLKSFILKNNFFSNIEVIPEIISDEFFKVKKIHKKKEQVNFLYVGYAIKALELELIKQDLEKLSDKYNIKLITICEKPPKINIKIRKEFIKYNQYSLPQDMMKGDIFINPRDLSESYNLGHSFIKIGYPMSVGLPVIASPIPSYLGSPALIVDNEDNWYDLMEKLIIDHEQRNVLGRKGGLYCYKHFSKTRILKQYIDCFTSII